MPKVTRRSVLRGAGLVMAGPMLGALAAGSRAGAEEPTWRHGIALFGDLKYPPRFPFFDYVNPSAPKAGTLRQAASGTYDNFNVVVAGLKGDLVTGIDSIYETLLMASLDEPASAYGLIAEAASFPPDFSSVTYRLRKEAKWHDGTPITPSDVVFSFDAFKHNSPEISAYYRRVVKAEETGEREVTFTFAAPFSRELPQIVGELMVVPRHWWSGTDRTGRRRDVAATTLEPPLGSGPYRIKSFEAGRWIVYERVANYWGRELNVRIGRDNFDEMRFDYYRDTAVEFEAFKADQFDWRTENTARNWATGYDFPAVGAKRVILEEFPVRSAGIMQAFAFNTRRSKFQDARLRRAFNFAFDFEQINEAIFYGQYRRIASYFAGTELAATGLPGNRERDILDAVRGQVPDEVFTTPFWNPVAGQPGAARANLIEAMRLLDSAGYAVRDLKLVNATSGEPLAVEFLLSDPNYESFVLIYRDSLMRLGIDVSVRVVDDIQYVNRLRDWDFDIIIAAWPESLSPGNEQRDYWGSRAADRPGSQNFIGIRNPAVDTLIDNIVAAASRDELIAATRALDRVLLWNHYVVPQWYYGEVRTARWDRFARPRAMPMYGAAAFPTIWWWDTKRAAAVASKS